MITKIRNTVVRIGFTALFFLLIGAVSRLNPYFDVLDPPEDAQDFYLFIFPRTPLHYKVLPVFLLCWFAVIVFALALFGLSYDPYLRRAMIGEKKGLFRRIGWTVSAPSFWYELAVILVLIFVLPSRFLGFKKYFPIATYAVAAAAFFIACVVATAQVNFLVERAVRPVKILIGTINRGLLQLIVFVFGLPVLLAVYAAFLTNRVATVSVFLTVILGSLLFVYLRAVVKRGKLMRRLTKICEEKQYSMTRENYYRSILLPNKGPEITIRTGEGTYACKLLNSFAKKTPLYLAPSEDQEGGSGLLVGRGYAIQYAVKTHYSFAPGDKKILILIPVPHFVYKKASVGWGTLLAADRVGDFTVYSLSAFLNALDLNALEAARQAREW